jgi:preprotein translocase subunit SecG
MSIVMPLLIALHLLVCVFMILIVLMQRPRSEGLGAAFGGGMTDNIFGAQTTNVLARFTTWLALGFFAITLLLSILTAKSSAGKTAIQERLMSAPVPAAVAPTPAATEAPSASPAASVAPASEPSASTTQPAVAPSPAASPAN